MANVFISHRTADLDAAKLLAAYLTSYGHDVWLDEWQIGIGDSIVEKVNAGLEGASYLVLCFSSSGMSDWVNREWMSALSRQLSGGAIKVLPVLLSGGSPPAILHDIKYADLTKDWDKGVAALARSIR